MPVTAKVCRLDGHHDDVTLARHDVAIAARAQVLLVGLVRLDEPNLDLTVRLGIVHQPNSTQRMSAIDTANAAPTKMMSDGRRFMGRFGSKPISQRYEKSRFSLILAFLPTRSRR